MSNNQNHKIFNYTMKQSSNRLTSQIDSLRLFQLQSDKLFNCLIGQQVIWIAICD